MIMSIAGVDVSLRVSSQPYQARGSPVTVTATISSTHSTNFIGTVARLNNHDDENTIGVAKFYPDSEECLNKLVPNMDFRCCLRKVNLTKIHIVEVYIEKIKPDHETVIWNINKNPYPINLNVIDCRNVSLSGVAQDVPINMGYRSTHTFSCITGYQGIPTVAVCQADATWGLKPFCVEDVAVTPHTETWSTNFFGSLYQARFLLNQNFKSASWLLGTEKCTVDCQTNNTLSNSELNHFKCSCIISGELCYSQLTTKTHLRSIFNNMEVKFQTNSSAWKKVVHISDCLNVTFSGVVQDVPVNRGYLSTHTFSCIQPFYLSATALAVCQSDATWNITSFCTKVPVCNNSDIPSNDLYQQPTSGTTFYPHSTTLICNQYYIGTVKAQCTKHGTWSISHNCTAKGFPVGHIVGITVVVQVAVLVVICLMYFAYKMKSTRPVSEPSTEKYSLSSLENRPSEEESRKETNNETPLSQVEIKDSTRTTSEPSTEELSLSSVECGEKESCKETNNENPLSKFKKKELSKETTSSPSEDLWPRDSRVNNEDSWKESLSLVDETDESDDVDAQITTYVNLLQTKKFDEAITTKQQLVRSIEGQAWGTTENLEGKARNLRNNSRYLEAILFFTITADFYVKNTPDVVVAKSIVECAGKVEQTIKLLMETCGLYSKSRNKHIVRDRVIPLMRDMIQQIRGLEIDEKIRCVEEAWCLHYIELSQSCIGDLASEETTIKEGLELMKTKLGNRSSKYEIYGVLLNNLGIVCGKTSRNKEAIEYYAKAIEVYKTAEDLSDVIRAEKIAESEENIMWNKL